MDRVYTAKILYIQYVTSSGKPEELYWQDPSKKGIENYATEDLSLPRLETFIEPKYIPYFRKIFTFALEHDVAEQNLDENE